MSARASIASSSAWPSARVVEDGRGGRSRPRSRTRSGHVPTRDRPDRPGARPVRRAGARPASDSPASWAGWCEGSSPNTFVRERLDPVGLRARQVVACVQTVAETDQARSELALVERSSPALGDRAQGQRRRQGARPARRRSTPAARLASCSAPRSSSRRRLPASSGLAGKPVCASRIAGASRSASGIVPKRSCSATQPSTQPGTVTVRMSWWNGISACPSRRSAVGVGTRPGPAAGVERGRRPVAVDEREQVAAHPALVGGRRRPSRRWSRSPRRRRCRPPAGSRCRRSWPVVRQRRRRR